MRQIIRALNWELLRNILNHLLNPMHIYCRIRDLYNWLGYDFNFRNSTNHRAFLLYERFYHKMGL